MSIAEQYKHIYKSISVMFSENIEISKKITPQKDFNQTLLGPVEVLTKLHNFMEGHFIPLIQKDQSLVNGKMRVEFDDGLLIYENCSKYIGRSVHILSSVLKYINDEKDKHAPKKLIKALNGEPEFLVKLFKFLVHVVINHEDNERYYYFNGTYDLSHAHYLEFKKFRIQDYNNKMMKVLKETRYDDEDTMISQTTDIIYKSIWFIIYEAIDLYNAI